MSEQMEAALIAGGVGLFVGLIIDLLLLIFKLL